MDLVEGGSARIRSAVSAVPAVARRSTAARPAQATDILVTADVSGSFFSADLPR
ncbi:hypothetical protein SMA5143A_5186 [Streptomyces sp. MA5143a]|nr:hypothetical protein SMA5143A_5186 [Streptomyces sp. MA5143a]